MTVSMYIRKGHRIIAILWLLFLILTLAVPSASEQLPGPSIPGLLFIATIITGTYLLTSPWVRMDSSISDRLHRLTDWSLTKHAMLVRSHRLVATLFLVLLIAALALEAAGIGLTQEVLLPIVVVLLFNVITGVYMFLRPWVIRFRGRQASTSDTPG